jgi:NADH dehydrogenase FAD-containing subunit
MADVPHVVILGAGFGGIGALKKLRDAGLRITLIDKHDYHSFQPLLYQVGH